LIAHINKIICAIFVILIIMLKLFPNKVYGLFVLLMIAALPMACKAQSVKASAKNAHNIVFIEDSWDEALRQAALQNKYIFVDAYASWCGPCKMLKKYTFSNQKVADFFNANFVNVSIDMEKGDGPRLATAWRMTEYPTMIIFDSRGKPVLGTAGYMGASDLLKFGQQGLTKKGGI
jgi:thioredoxin 1